MAYNGSIDLINGLRPKNNGTFPLVAAKDVYVDDVTRLDTKLQQLGSSAAVAPTEATNTASMAHAVGDYFILGDTLYVATAAVAAGAEIVTSGSEANCRAAVLGNEVSANSDAIDSITEHLTFTVDGTLNGLISGWAIQSSSIRKCAYASIVGARHIRVEKVKSKKDETRYITTVVSVIESDVPEGARYLVISCYNSNTDTLSWTTILASIVITGDGMAIDATARAQIADVAESVDAVENSVEATNDLINNIHGYVNYGYNEPCDYDADPSASGASKIGIKRDGVYVVLNGVSCRYSSWLVWHSARSGKKIHVYKQIAGRGNH